MNHISAEKIGNESNSAKTEYLRLEYRATERRRLDFTSSVLIENLNPSCAMRDLQLTVALHELSLIICTIWLKFCGVLHHTLICLLIITIQLQPLFCGGRIVED